MNSDLLLYELSKNLADSLIRQCKTITCAESCTGGWIAKVITDISGSSTYFQRGFITYSDEAKHEILGVSKNTLRRYGAVSEQVVIQMAEKALVQANADFSVSVSGIAGPNGGTDKKPIGTVWFGFASNFLSNKRIVTRCCVFKGNRIQIRRQAVTFSLTTLLKEIIKT